MRHRGGERWPGAGRILDGGGPASSGPATLGALAGRLTATLPGYTPKHLAEKILTSRTALEGERKQVTVLFADCARFTELSRSVDAEELHQVMDGCFHHVLEAVHRYEGTVNQFGLFIIDKAGKIRYATSGSYFTFEGTKPVGAHPIPSNDEIVRELERG